MQPKIFLLMKFIFFFRNDSYFEVLLSFRQFDFIEKIHIRAYTLDDLIGSCGGYIGLFLGYALIQFPQFIEQTFHRMKSGIIPLSKE